MNRVYRSAKDKIVGGVCGGLGAYLRLDPWVLRIAFILLTLLNGAGLAVYFILWLLLPSEQAGAAPQSQQEIVRQNAQEIGERARQFGQEVRSALGRSDSPWTTGQQGNRRTIMAGAVLIGLGSLFLLERLGWLRPGVLWPVMLILIGAVLLINNLRKES